MNKKRILGEKAALEQEVVELLEEKERLKRELQKRENIDPYLAEVIKERDRLRAIFYKTTTEERVTIGKTELETILKQHFNYVEVKIEKVCAGVNKATHVYPPIPFMPLLFKMDIMYLKKREAEEGK